MESFFPTGEKCKKVKKRPERQIPQGKKGDYQNNSDIDIMILVKANDEEIKKKFNSVCDLAFDYELEYGIVISPLVKNEEHFMKWSDALPFYRNVKMEGVIVDQI